MCIITPLNPQLAIRESVVTLWFIFPTYWTSIKHHCSISELHPVNSLLVLSWLLVSLLVISIGRDLLIVFTYFWKCLFFYSMWKESLHLSRLTSIDQTRSLLTLPVYVTVRYMQRPPEASRNAGLYFSTVRGCPLNGRFPWDFMLEKLGVYFSCFRMLPL